MEAKLKISKSSAVDFHVKTSLAQARALASTGQGHLSGMNMPASLARFDQAGLLLKTSRCSDQGASTPFSGPWPRSGMMRNGIVYQLPTLARLIRGTEFGLLPTPSGTSNHGKNHVSGRMDEWGGSSNPFRGTLIGKIHSPRFEEWMMGYPDRWTELTASEIPLSRKSRRK